MASFSDFEWQNRKECPNQSTNNGDMAEIAIVCELHTSQREGELLEITYILVHNT